jgi:hypothetical protein|tara:strand:- start:45 stop:854 length:810 start_codon:yes stop_codon:yes gene_type:complete
MRREGGKLSSLNWKLVLFAGIFQILTLIFDQLVIQYEEKNRQLTFNLMTESEQRSAYLSMNSRVNNFITAFEDIMFFTTSSNFSNDKKKYLFHSDLLDQSRLIEDIFRDASIKKAFLNKTIEAPDVRALQHLTEEQFNIGGGPEIPTKIFGYENFFTELVENNYTIAESLDEDSDFTMKLDDSKIIMGPADFIQAQVEWNNFYLSDLGNNLVDLVNFSEKKIDKTNNEISSIQTNKQLMLLLGVTFQLLSLLCLLFLFRNLLSLNKLSK